MDGYCKSFIYIFLLDLCPLLTVGTLSTLMINKTLQGFFVFAVLVCNGKVIRRINKGSRQSRNYYSYRLKGFSCQPKYFDLNSILFPDLTASSRL